jgi:hypothetical protein
MAGIMTDEVLTGCKSRNGLLSINRITTIATARIRSGLLRGGIIMLGSDMRRAR